MTFTKEQIRKAMNCKTVDELLALAKSEGVELSREQAEEYIAATTGKRKLTNEELSQVVGGLPNCWRFAGLQQPRLPQRQSEIAC